MPERYTNGKPIKKENATKKKQIFQSWAIREGNKCKTVLEAIFVNKNVTLSVNF